MTALSLHRHRAITAKRVTGTRVALEKPPWDRTPGTNATRAKPSRRFSESVKHGLEIEGGTADELEHISGRGLLLQRLAQLIKQLSSVT